MGLTLSDLALKHGTDKWGDHRYAQHYDAVLSPRREEPLTLIEIGIGGYNDSVGGASLKMWEEFFPNALIVGVDLEDKSVLNTERILTFQGNQSDPDLWSHIVGKVGRPDIVVDDGSHVCEDIINTLAMVWPHLKDGGTYWVEDLQTSYWPRFGGTPPPGRWGRDTVNWADYAGNPSSMDIMASGGAYRLHHQLSSMEFFKELVDGLNWEEFLIPGLRGNDWDRTVSEVRFWHNLVCVKKGLNAEGSNLVIDGLLQMK